MSVLWSSETIGNN
jgi:F0F1-type ATP synthase alpha subunit